MKPAVSSAIALLKAKVEAIADAYKDPRRAKEFIRSKEQFWDQWEKKPPTMASLRRWDRDFETQIRCGLTKENREMVPAKLVAKFGRSTVGESVEVVAKRVLKRGRVLNKEEAQAIEPIAGVHIDHGIELLGSKDARRLTALWSKYRHSGPKK